MRRMFTNLDRQNVNLYKILSNPMPGLVRVVFLSGPRKKSKTGLKRKGLWLSGCSQRLYIIDDIIIDIVLIRPSLGVKSFSPAKTFRK